MADHVTFAVYIAWAVLESLLALELEGMPALSCEHVKLEALPSLQRLSLKAMRVPGLRGYPLVCPTATLDCLTVREVQVVGL